MALGKAREEAEQQAAKEIDDKCADRQCQHAHVGAKLSHAVSQQRTDGAARHDVKAILEHLVCAVCGEDY